MTIKLMNIVVLTLPLLITACKDNQHALKPVEYWMEDKERRMDYWLVECKRDDATNDNCAVIARINMFGEEAGREMYDRIIRQRNK